MRLLCMSDLHGHLQRYDAPEFAADVAVIAGDVTPADRKHYGGNVRGLFYQEQWFIHTFLPWVETLPVAHVVMTWGNHDHLGEHPDRYRTLAPPNVHILVNTECVIDGVRFYGIPQTPRFYDWAFNMDDTDDALGRLWSQVPAQTDVLLSHGPPAGAVDWSTPGGAALGSQTQRRWLENPEATNHPSVIVCGHIHGAGGHEALCGRTRVMNVAIVNEHYTVARHPTRITL